MSQILNFDNFIFILILWFRTTNERLLHFLQLPNLQFFAACGREQLLHNDAFLTIFIRSFTGRFKNLLQRNKKCDSEHEEHCLEVVKNT